MSGTSYPQWWEDSALLWEAVLKCLEMQASKMFQSEWMDQSMEKRNRSFSPDFKWGCNCSHVEMKTYSPGMTGTAPPHLQI